MGSVCSSYYYNVFCLFVCLFVFFFFLGGGSATSGLMLIGWRAANMSSTSSSPEWP